MPKNTFNINGQLMRIDDETGEVTVFEEKKATDRQKQEALAWLSKQCAAKSES